MAKKYYAVRVGKTTGIFTSWDECKANVHGYPCAEFKSFTTLPEAKAFMSGKETDVTVTMREGAATAYVDGSYNAETTEFSYGAVIFVGDEVYEMNKAFSDPDLALMRNVAGEIKGAEAAMTFCIDRGISKLDIYYDYQGIEKWCTGDWKTNKAGTISYKNYYDSIKTKLDVRFVKVKGHSGDKYNDRADELAKAALGIEGR